MSFAEFLSFKRYAVVGASTNREKYGNKVLRWYMARDLNVTPIHPKESAIEGLETLSTIQQLPNPTQTPLSIITPPQVSYQVISEAAELGIPMVWLQPGAENAECIRLAEEKGLACIAEGPCILVQGTQEYDRQKSQTKL